MSWYQKLLEHKLAANLLMIMVLGLGLWGAQNVKSQLFPNFNAPFVRVAVSWPGADAQAVRDGIGIQLDQSLSQTDLFSSVRSTSRDGSLELGLRLADNVEGDEAVAQVEELIAAISLPDGAEVTQLEQVVRYESVASLLVHGDAQIEELRSIAYQIEAELQKQGLAQVSLSGVPDRRRVVEIDLAALATYGLSLDSIANTINANFEQVPAGTLVQGSNATTIVSDSPQWSLTALNNVRINEHLTLGQIANIYEIYDDSSRVYQYQGQTAIRIDVSRQSDEDTLENAEKLNTWLAQFESVEGVEITVFNQAWLIVKAQLQLVIENGLLGMALVILVLFVFLRTRIAWWVAAGIPVAFAGTLAFMGYTDTSINTISLFGFIIAIGIIVDDAIVVAEDAAALEADGFTPKEAGIKAAKRMLPAVIASSLTTIAAFLPLLLIGGQFGSFLVDVPLVVTAAILASLVECFIILPGHLGHSKKVKQPGRFRVAFESGFNKVRDNYFMPMVSWSLYHASIVFASFIGIFMLTIALVQSGKIEFQAAPALEDSTISVSLQLEQGASFDQAKAALTQLESLIADINKRYNDQLINTVLQEFDDATNPENISLRMEMTSDTDRALTNAEILAELKQKYVLPDYVLNYSARRSFRGPGGGGDLSIRLEGEDINELKAASEYLQAQLLGNNQLSEISDDVPLGDGQYKLSLTQLALTLNLDMVTINRQLKNYLSGIELTTVETGFESIQVQLQLPESQRQQAAWLTSLPIVVNGQSVPLGSLVSVEYERGIDRITARDGVLSVTVSADYSGDQLEDIYAQLETTVLANVRAQFNVNWEFEGQREELDQFKRDAIIAAIVALALIYIILAWVFESWSWPIAILITVPFGLIGAILGHWIMAMPLSTISIFGLIGLSGIIINDSIVLVSVFRRYHHQGLEVKEAIVKAASTRLRPVILTSITTMAGLIPLIFETSLDAALLQPIAVGLVFGLGFGTLLILLMVPTLLYAIEWLKGNVQQKQQA